MPGGFDSGFSDGFGYPQVFFVGDVDSDWADAGNWASFSGGPGGYKVPSASDIATFDANSPSCTCDGPANCLGLYLDTGFANTLNFSTYGSNVGAIGMIIDGGTLNMGSGAVNITATASGSGFIQSGGTVTLTSATLTCNGDFKRSAGTLTHNSGTVYMDRVVSADRNIDVNGATLYNLTYEYGAYAITWDSDMTIAGTFLYMSGRRIQGSATITLTGDMETRSTNRVYGNASTLHVNGTGDQEIRTNTGEKVLCANMIIDKASGTLTFTNAFDFYLNNFELEYIQGTIDWSGCTSMRFSGHHTTIRCTADLTIGSTVAVYFDSGAFSTYVEDGNLIILGNFEQTYTGSLYTSSGAEIHLKGADNNIVSVIGNYPGTLMYRINGTGDQAFRSSSGNGECDRVYIDKASGTLTITGTIGIGCDSGTTCLEHVQGTVDASASTLRIGAGANDAQVIKTGSMELGNLEFNPAGPYDVTIDGPCIVGGDLTFTSLDDLHAINSGYINLKGDLDSNDSDVKGTTCPINLVGTSDQTIYCNNGEFGGGDLTINKATGVAWLGENFAPASWAGNLVVSQGILDIDGYDILIGSQTLDIDGTFRWNGSETVTATVAVDGTSSTVKYYGASVSSTISAFSTTYFNLILDGAGSTWSQGAAVAVNGQFDQVNGAYVCNNWALTIGGDLNWDSGLNAGDFQPGSAVVTVGGSVDQPVNGIVTYATSTFKFTGDGEVWQTYNGADQSFYKFEVDAGVDFTFQGMTSNNQHYVYDVFTLGAGSKLSFDGNGTFSIMSGSSGTNFNVDSTSEIELKAINTIFGICVFDNDCTFQWNPCTLTCGLGLFRIYSNSGGGTRNIQLQDNITISGEVSTLMLNEVQSYFGTRELDFNGYDLTIEGAMVSGYPNRGFGLIVGSSTLSTGNSLQLNAIQGATSYGLDVDGGSVTIGTNMSLGSADWSKTIRLRNSASIEVGTSYDGSWFGEYRTSDLFEGDGTGLVKFSGTGNLLLKAGHDFADVQTEVALTGSDITLYQDTAFDSLTITSGTFDCDVYKLTINYNSGSGKIQIDGGVLDLGTYTGHIIEGSWDYNGGTITPNSGRVDFGAPASPYTSIDGSFSLYNVRIYPQSAGGSAIRRVDVNNDLTITNDLSYAGYPSNFFCRVDGTGTVHVKGDYTGENANSYVGTATLQFDGASGDQDLNNLLFAGDELIVNKASGTAVFTSDPTFGSRFQPASDTDIRFQSAVDLVTNSTNMTVVFRATHNMHFYNGFTAYDMLFQGAVDTGNTTCELHSQTIVVSNDCSVDLDTNSFLRQINDGTVECRGDLSLLINDAQTHSRGTALFKMTTASIATLTGDGTTKYFNDITINKSVAATTTLAGDLGLIGGTFYLQSGILDLAGYDLRADTITLDDEMKVKGDETVTADTTSNFNDTVRFYDSGTTAIVNNISSSYTNIIFGASKTHQFTASATVTITGNIDSDGTSSTRSIIRSTSDGTAALINFSGTSLLGDEMDVKDSDASPNLGIRAFGSVDSGGNTDWAFNNDTLYFVGTTDSDWNKAGNWSVFSGETGGDGVPGSTQTAVFDSGSPSASPSSPPASVLNLWLLTGFANTCQFNFSMTVNNELKQEAGTLLMGNTGTAFTITNNWDHTGGTAVAPPNGDIYVQDEWTRTAPGAFTHNNAQVHLTTGGSRTIDVNGVQVWKLTYNAGDQVTFSSDIEVLDDFLMSSGFKWNGPGEVKVHGDVDTQDELNSTQTGILRLVGTGTQNVTGDGDLPSVYIDKASGTAYFFGNIRIFGSGKTFEWVQGTVDMGTSAITIGAGSATLDPGGNVAFYDLILANGGYGFSLASDCDVTNELTLGSMYSFNDGGGKIHAKGDILVTNQLQGGSGGGDAQVIIDGTGDQDMDANGSWGYLPSVEINKSSGTLTIVDEFRFLGDSGCYFKHTTGTVDASGSLMVFLGDSRTLDLTGGMDFGDVEINYGGGYTQTINNGPMNVKGYLRFYGNSVQTLNGSTIDAYGDVVFDNTANISGTTGVTFKGSAGQNVTGSGTYFPDGTFTVDKTGGEVTISTDITLTNSGQDLIVTNGTLKLVGRPLTVNDRLEVHSGGLLKIQGNETLTIGTLDLQTGSTVEYHNAAVTATIDNFATTFYNLTFGASKTHNVTASATIVVNGYLDSAGTLSTRALLRSSSPGSPWNLTLGIDSLITDNVDVEDSNASSGTGVKAPGSFDGGGNTNWFFDPDALYFVGDTDDKWNTAANWSLADGAPGGDGVPITSTNVFLTSLSPNCTLDVATGLAARFDTTGYTNTFNMGSNELEIYFTAIILGSGMTLGGTGKFIAAGTFVPCYLDAPSIPVYDFEVNGTGNWAQPVNTFAVTNDLNVVSGKFVTANFPITIGNDLNLGVAQGFEGGSSTVNITGDLNYTVDDPIKYETSTIRMLGDSKIYTPTIGIHVNFYNLYGPDTGKTLTLNHQNSNNIMRVYNQMTTGAGTLNRISNPRLEFYGTNADVWLPNASLACNVPLSWVLSAATVTNLHPCVYGDDLNFSHNTASNDHLIQLQNNITTAGSLYAWEAQSYFASVYRHFDVNGYTLSVGGDMALGATRGYGLLIGSGSVSVTGDLDLGAVRGTTTHLVALDAGSLSVGGSLTKNANGSIDVKIDMLNSSSITVGGDWDTVNWAYSNVLTYTGTGNTVEFDGTGDYNIATYGEQTFPETEVNKTSSVTLQQDTAFDTLTVTSGTFDCNDYDITINYYAGSGKIQLDGGEIKLGSGTHEIWGNWANNGGTVTYETAHVKFMYRKPSGTPTFSGTCSLYEVSFTAPSFSGSNHYRYNVSGNMTVMTDLVMDGYAVGGWHAQVKGSGEIHVRGDLDGNSKEILTDLDLYIDGPTGDQHWYNLRWEANGGVSNIYIQKASGTLILGSTWTVNYGTTPYSRNRVNVYLNSAVDGTTNSTKMYVGVWGDSDVYFHNDDLTVSSLDVDGRSGTGSSYLDLGGNTLYVLGRADVELNAYGGHYRLINNGTLDIAGDLYLTVPTTSNRTDGTATIKLTGSSDTALSGAGTARYLNPVIIDKDAGHSVTLIANLGINGSSLTIDGGIFDLAGYDLNAGNLLQNNATLMAKGDETVAATANASGVGALAEFYDDGVTGYPNRIMTNYYDLTFGGGKTHIFDASSTINVAGTLRKASSPAAQAILLSSSTGTQWNIILSPATGDSLLGAGVQVRDSDATGGQLIDAKGSEDLANNDNWFFGQRLVIPRGANILAGNCLFWPTRTSVEVHT